ncbi:MAG: elongation factor G, partial [Lachnospiraceae bacterium]|nr:elongation factor G [Lachnospiraceae bacterium]
MKVYTTDKIRNVAILGHGGAGKTSLVEAMALLSGLTTRLGKVDDGNTISDFDKEEQKRKFSISTSVVPIEWEDNKINIFDTPGFFDFVGEVEEALSAAASAIIVINGKSGIEPGTKKAWDLCEKYNIPRYFYISNMDVDDASFRKILEELTELYGKKIAPFNFPIRENEKFVGYVNVVSEKGYKWNAQNKAEECDIPDYLSEYLTSYRESLMEAVAETSEDFMERYFGGETFSDDEIRAALHMSVCDGTIVPLCCGSNTLVQGIFTLLDDIIKYLPSPQGRKFAGISTKTSEVFEADYDFSKAKSAFVWKTIVDPYIGKYSIIKVASGVIKTGDVLYNDSRDQEIKVAKLYTMCGSKASEIGELHAGDIGALSKLDQTRTGDTLSTKSNPIHYAMIPIPVPYNPMRYRPVNKGDVDKLSQALQKICTEDLTLKNINDAENRQTLLVGMGDQHLDVVKAKLLSDYKVEIVLSKPKVAYRETIIGQSDVEGKYKKQTGGHGQYGHVKMRFSPLGDNTRSFEFDEEVVGGSVPKNFFPAVEKGLNDSVDRGPLAAYPVVGVKAVLYDGSYHPVDSSEQSFKMATRMAFKD